MPSRRETEITLILSVAAVVTWAAIVIVVFGRQPVLGGDFMQFYVLGTLARTGDWAAQYDWPALHELQTSLVPGSDPYYYAPAYPPLLSALYLPLASLPFPAAFATWALASIALYAWLMRLTTRACSVTAPHNVVIGGLLFPPFIALVTSGQSTLWPLAGFVTGWWALERGRPVLAGALFAAVSLKPHFGLALAVVPLLAGTWRIVLGAVLGLTAIALSTYWVCGADAIAAYWSTTLGILADPAALDPLDARHTHGLRAALAAHVSPRAALAAWALVSAAVAWVASTVWRRRESWSIRVAVLLVATLLISPHLLVYDGVLLAPAVVWLADAAVREQKWDLLAALALLAICFAVPAARVLNVPLTLPLLGWVLWRCRGR
jgi:hypothetical protein